VSGDVLTIGHLLAALSDYQIAGDEPAIRAVIIDSRQAIPSSLFVALAGERTDGHAFVGDAFARGAIAALVQKQEASHPYPYVDVSQPLAAAPAPPFCLLVENPMHALQEFAAYWRNQFQLQVIGVTGSIGKSSSKELIYTVLSQRFRTLKSEGNLNNEIGLPLTILNLDKSHQYAILEMGTYGPGEIARLCQIAQPHIGVLTMIGPVHMERMGDLETITSAKQELVESLPPDGHAILNFDDERVMSMAAHTNAQILTYGLNEGADLWAEEITSMGLEGIRFRLHYQDTNLHVQVPLLGRHSVHTALRAAAVGLVAGLSWDEILRGMQDPNAQLRLVAVEGPQGSLIVDDTYNSSPESALAALNLLRDLGGRRIAVLGDMLELGAAERESHELVGRRAARVADILVTVGPRSRMFAEAARHTGMADEAIHELEDADAAIALLEAIIQPDDTTLIKASRGVQLERVVTALSQATQAEVE